ncbi:hypothetical protein N0V82_006829 [Gnomoniopsis sp. IMI 355080]|nr:hypothetical protein N0V82_006829 [Gnomoniopsis sp. IMI 355080]
MADNAEHNAMLNNLGRLGLHSLAYEIQAMIAMQAILSASNSTERAILATVNKTWQTFVEAETFRNIHVVLEATDQTGAFNLIGMLTPARLTHLKELAIDIEWPFFIRAQTVRRFSGSVAVRKMNDTILILCNFFRGLHGADVDPTARGLNIMLQPIEPAFVRPVEHNLSSRALFRRQFTHADISSWWSTTDMLKLSPFQQTSWVSGTAGHLLGISPTLSIVTGLAFPPDFFPPSTMKLLLNRFPNLRSVKLSPMCGLGNPGGWRTDFFLSDFRSFSDGYPIPKISALTLSRNPFDVGHWHSEFESASRLIHFNFRAAETDPRLYAYIDAIRNYTRSLRALRFDHFAAPTQFYKQFFAGIPGPSFKWEVLKELHITMYGNQRHPRKRVPMALHDGAHLRRDEQYSILQLFHAAGFAAASMPCLQKMTIHIPRHDQWYIMAVTLQFSIQPKEDTSLHSIWGSLGKLELWAAPRAVWVEDIWKQSIAGIHKKLQCIEWHSEECPDPMKGFGHWGKDMGEGEEH